jgi:hypothetical protein
MNGTLIIHAAVEGIVDEAVVQKLIIEAGGCPGTVYGKSGKAFLRQKIQGFNNAAIGQAESLKRAIICLQRMIEKHKRGLQGPRGR